MVGYVLADTFRYRYTTAFKFKHGYSNTVDIQNYIRPLRVLPLFNRDFFGDGKGIILWALPVYVLNSFKIIPSFKMKVGLDVQKDKERLAFIRNAIGEDSLLMLDANQIWGVEEAISHMLQLVEFKPYWIEEPTARDDVLGSQAPRGSV